MLSHDSHKTPSNQRADQVPHICAASQASRKVRMAEWLSSQCVYVRSSLMGYHYRRRHHLKRRQRQLSRWQWSWSKPLRRTACMSLM